MTPSKRAAELESFLEEIAILCENIARVNGSAVAVGLPPVSLNIDHAKDLAKRIRHKIADIGPPTQGVLHDRDGDTRCPECGEVVGA